MKRIEGLIIEMNKIKQFSLNIDNVTLVEACDKVIEMAENKASYDYVVTPNVDHIIKLQKDFEFREVYESASLILADGMPLIWASKFLKRPLKEKVSGSDLFPEICKAAAEKNLSVYFLGGLDNVAKKASETLIAKYPKLNVVGHYSPPFGFENDQLVNESVVLKIKKANPDILFVGVGAPKQEKWIFNNLNRLCVPVSLGIGASFDFIAGTKKRAPIWMQNSGLEWLYRFFQEPKRLFKRYFIDDSKFVYLLMKEKFLK
ncbi:WecB/TagA/CpsF family glycosyltransferase [Peribacillus frigoritolerans]